MKTTFSSARKLNSAKIRLEEKCGVNILTTASISSNCATTQPALFERLEEVPVAANKIRYGDAQVLHTPIIPERESYLTRLCIASCAEYLACLCNASCFEYFACLYLIIY